MHNINYYCVLQIECRDDLRALRFRYFLQRIQSYNENWISGRGFYE